MTARPPIAFAARGCAAGFHFSIVMNRLFHRVSKAPASLLFSHTAGAKDGSAKSSLGFSPIPRCFRAKARTTLRSDHAAIPCRAPRRVCEECRLAVRITTELLVRAMAFLFPFSISP